MNGRLVRGCAASLGLNASACPGTLRSSWTATAAGRPGGTCRGALGHRAGVERLRGIIRLSSDIGIETLTLYAFSTENWKRPSEEISALCALFVEYFSREFDALHANGVAIRALGDVRAFPERVYALVEKAERRTADNDGLQLNVALNYGSRSELLRAVNLAAASGRTDWDEAAFDGLLYTHGQAPVDLLIRTGGRPPAVQLPAVSEALMRS